MEFGIIKKLLSLVETGEDAALVTIIRTLGSTPRNPGAKMLVLPDGRVFGTIGGGSGEAEAIKKAVDVLQFSKTPKKIRLEMTNEAAAEDGMACGGVQDVFIDYISRADREARQVFSSYLASLRKKDSPVLVTVTEAEGVKNNIIGRKALFYPLIKKSGDLYLPELAEQIAELTELARCEKKIKLFTLGEGEKKNIELLCEPAFWTPQLLVLGGGHISKPLVKMASTLGYGTTVVDDRPDFANTTRFPDADRVVCQDFNSFMKNVDIDPSTFVVIVTRGHKHDLACLRDAIGQPAAYIGMIGSRKKVSEVFLHLESEGIPTSRLQGVHAPIGLKIGSETPEEIALSILAEIVSVWRPQ